MSLLDRFNEASNAIKAKQTTTKEKESTKDTKKVTVNSSSKRNTNKQTSKEAYDSYLSTVSAVKRNDPTLQSASMYRSTLLSHYNTVENAIEKLDSLAQADNMKSDVYRYTKRSLIATENEFDIENVLPEATIIQASPVIDGNQRFIVAQIKSSNFYGDLANAKVLIPTSEFGNTLNNQTVDRNIGQTIRLGILGFVDMSKINHSNDGFIILGSISMAEWIIKDQLFFRTGSWLTEHEQLEDKDVFGHAIVEFKATRKDKPTEKEFKVNRQYLKDNSYNANIKNFSTYNKSVIIEYSGITLTVFFENFTHVTRNSEIANMVAGNKQCKFTITSLQRKRAQNLDKVMDSYIDELLGKKLIVPKYDYQFIFNSKLYEDDPTETVKKLYESKTSYVANIANVDPIYGIFVEVAPSVIYKANDVTDQRPTYRDGKAYTRCVVKIANIDQENPNHGKATILGYPDGLA